MKNQFYFEKKINEGHRKKNRKTPKNLPFTALLRCNFHIPFGKHSVIQIFREFKILHGHSRVRSFAQGVIHRKVHILNFAALFLYHIYLQLSYFLI